MKDLLNGKFGATPWLFAAASLFVSTGFAQTTTTTATPTTEQVAGPTPTDQSATMLEKVVVTGSNIPLAIDALSVPITTIPQEEIATSGVADNTLDLLRKLAPSITGIGTENAQISTATNYGGSQVLIHGLSVLVLVNGHRIANDAAQAVGANTFSDLNMIPPAAVERIDVLQDGSSAIYGSDAVGGVINIILKRDYNGWEMDGHYGFSPTSGHYSERSFDVTGGVSNGTTSMTVSAGYSKTDPIFFSQSGRSAIANDYANDYLPGVIDIYSLATGNDEDYTLAPGVNAPPGGGLYTIQQLTTGIPGVNGGKPVYVDDGVDLGEGNPTSDYFNFSKGQTLVESTKAQTFSLNVTHTIFGDSLKASADIEYDRTFTQSQLNAQPIYPYISDPYTDNWYNGGPPTPGTQYVLVSSPTNPFSQAYIDQMKNYNPNTGTGTGYGIDVHQRFIQFPRIFQNDSTEFNINGELSGQITPDYSWTLDGVISRYDINYQNQNVINANNFYADLASGLLNPFAIVQAPGVLPGNLLGEATMTGDTTFSEGSAIINGTPFELPAGKLAFAVGGSYQREVLGAYADPNTEQHLWLNSPTIKPIDTSRYDEAVFAELEIPVFSSEMNIPGFHTLNLDLAGRSDDYQLVGTSRVPKVSLKYAPINDELAFRFSAGKSFVAPTLYNLYGPVNVGASNEITYTPYKASAEVGPVQFESESGSNPALQPYTATTWTAGFQYTPKAVKDLTVSLDFFSTHESGLPGAVDQQTIIQSVESLGAASPFDSLVHFSSPTGASPTAPGQISTRPSASIWIVAPTINLSGQLTRGTDLSVEYDRETDSLGKFVFKSTAVIYNTEQLDLLPIQPYYSYIGQTSVNEGTVPHWRTFTTIDWYYRGLQFTIAHTFIPTVKDVGSGGSNASAPVTVNSYSQFDATLAYSFEDKHRFNWGKYLDGLTIRIGVNNIADAQPPLSFNAQSEDKTDIGFYNGIIGIMTYVNATYKF